jgi:hypothetical protein
MNNNITKRYNTFSAPSFASCSVASNSKINPPKITHSIFVRVEEARNLYQYMNKSKYFWSYWKGTSAARDFSGFLNKEQIKGNFYIFVYDDNSIAWGDFPENEIIKFSHIMRKEKLKRILR